MVAYLWVALGGALGSAARFGFALAAGRLWGESFPWGTIAINILGSFVIGFFGALTVPDGVLPASPNLRIFVMVGICGGFTTFSSFSLQTLMLARGGAWFAAMGNIVLSVALCLAAVTLGHVSAERIGLRRTAGAIEPHTVLAILDRTETARPVLAAAALAAGRLGLPNIEILHIRHQARDGFLPSEEVMTPERREEIGGAGAQRSAALRAIVESWRQSGGGGTWREVTGESERLLVEEAAGADLVVVARPPDDADAGAGADGRHAIHAALFEARRPILLVAQEAPSALGEVVAVAWKPSAAAKKALEAALPLLLRAGRVAVLIGTEEEGSEAEPARLLERLRAAGIAVAVRRFRVGGRAVGAALLEEARSEGADLLVMGAFTRGPFVERLFGGATRDILAAADIPVLLHH